MKYLIVHTHPNPSSFCNAITASICKELEKNNRDFIIRDLYKIRFDPALGLEDLAAMYKGVCLEDVRTEREYVSSADMLIFVFPVFFNNLPAMLKGYIDRVFSLGFGYGLENKRPVPLLTGKKSLIFSTTYSTDELSRENELFDDVRKTIAFPLKQFCGIKTLEHTFFTAVQLVTDDDRKRMLEQTREIIRKYLQ
ncbi:MAG TPA: NAD(P)H-dependent oxidoreductase [Candidatus Wunengus sp. YC65]|uniref:NAD(P)H-dependent oxidoreductase n=1 Tax=Candidatus Wunengus sp. YC65 TaxID=3367701 RepID=UPI0040253C12